jgi:hypothetical protein
VLYTTAVVNTVRLAEWQAAQKSAFRNRHFLQVPFPHWGAVHARLREIAILQ